MTPANGIKSKRGYRAPQKTALIIFEGTEYDGLEVRCKMGISMDGYLEFLGLQQGAAAAKEAQGDATKALEAIQLAERAFRLFGDKVLLEWNVEDEKGQPVPATGMGMMGVDAEFAMVVLNHWLEAVGKPPAPLSAGSSNGSMSVASPLPNPGNSVNTV